VEERNGKKTIGSRVKNQSNDISFRIHLTEKERFEGKEKSSQVLKALLNGKTQEPQVEGLAPKDPILKKENPTLLPTAGKNSVRAATSSLSFMFLLRVDLSLSSTQLSSSILLLLFPSLPFILLSFLARTLWRWRLLIQHLRELSWRIRHFYH
jgi:hypothetical protein